MGEPELTEEDQALAGALQKRDGGFVWRLLLRLAVIVLLITWLLLQGPGSTLGRWAADSFGSLTGG